MGEAIQRIQYAFLQKFLREDKGIVMGCLEKLPLEGLNLAFSLVKQTMRILWGHIIEFGYLSKGKLLSGILEIHE